MSNISTPSPATSPEPPSSSSDLIALETIESDDVISQTVLKTINSIDEKDDEHENDDNIENLSDLDTPVTIGAEFFPIASIPSMSPCTSSTTSSITSIVQTASQLTCLTASGEFFESTMIKCILIKNALHRSSSCVNLAGQLFNVPKNYCTD